MPRNRKVLAESLRRQVEHGSTYRTIRTALERGNATVKRWHVGSATPGSRLRIRKPHSWKVNYASNCTSPVVVYITGRPLAKGRKSVHAVNMNEAVQMQFVEAEVPCRKCDACLRRRAWHWRCRAVAQTKAASRTWFGTLTLAPEQHYRVAAACRVAASRNGDDFDMFSPERQFAERHKCISREITLYLKRIRKYSGSSIKFLCVAEAHKTGLPHYHMLVHEVGPHDMVRHRVLTEQWRVGFSNWKLVRDPLHVGYVTKYLAKSIMARVRASIDYNSTSSDIVQNERASSDPYPPSAPAVAGMTDLAGVPNGE